MHLEISSAERRPFCPGGDELRPWAPSQYPKIRLSVRSRQISKPRDLYLDLSDRFEIWQALRQQCCQCACQISKRYDNLKYQSRGFETLRDLTKRRLFGYWDGALVTLICISQWGHHWFRWWLVTYLMESIQTFSPVDPTNKLKQNLMVAFFYF